MASKLKARLIHGFGSVYQRKKGKSWTIDFYDEHGRRIQRTVPHAQSQKEAVHALMFERQKVFDRAYGIERRRREIKFSDFARIYLEDYAMIAKRSWKTDESRMKVLNGFFKDTELREITPLTVERFRKSRLKAGDSKSTTNRHLALLKTMFNVAIEENYAEENPVQKVKFYSEKDNLCERILTEKEEKKLYQASANYLKPILTVALNTGMRKGEILNLKWSQVDFKNRIIRVEKTKSARIRYVPMNDAVFNELSISAHGQNPFVFFNPETGRPWHDLKRQFRNACLKAGIEGLRFHDQRHTFADRLISAGVDIETVRDLLGHSSITTTQRYTHSNDERKRKAVELLPDREELGDNLVTKRIEGELIN